MGAWGTAIFSDDTAADTRDAFRDLIGEGLSTDAATERLIAESAEILEDEDDTLVFWLALAATQWKLGRLLNRVRDRAIEIIDSGADLLRFEEDCTKAEIKQRKKHLAALREQILSPQPEMKKLKRRVKSTTDFKAGDVASYRLDESTAVRFYVMRIWGDRGGIYSNICLLGLDDGSPFTKTAIKLSDTLGPHYTLFNHEPVELITMLSQGVQMPEPDTATYIAWRTAPVRGHACTWKDFPASLRKVLPQLGWTSDV